MSQFVSFLYLKFSNFAAMSKPEKKLFLLDAMALIYRAHFAFSKNPRINSKGMNTGAVLGFTNSLVEILTKENPTHIGVAFDTSAPTFRHESFSEYKANRDAQPEDIRVAIPIVKDIVKAFHIPALELDGYEADDIIGTMAKRAAKAGFEVFMMTPDKDFGQLVEEHVYLYKPAYMGNSVEVLGVPEVLEKWDIDRIDQVVDMLGLQGDSVDNIPGIPGVGPKTASQLLKKFGTVEGIVANVDQLKGKQKERVEEFGDQGIMSKQLALIHTDVPIDFKEEDFQYDGPNEVKVKELFNELEFRTLHKRLFTEGVAKAKKTSSGQLDMFSADAAPKPKEIETEPREHLTILTSRFNYHVIEKEDELDDLVKFLAKQSQFSIFVHTASTQTFGAEVLGIALSYYTGDAYYVPISESDPGPLEKLREVFENEEIAKVSADIKLDLIALKRLGYTLQGKFFDTMLAHYLIEPEMGHSLEVLANSYLNYTLQTEESFLGKGKTAISWKEIPVADRARYAGERVDMTLQLKDDLSRQLTERQEKDLFTTLEVPLAAVLADVELEGVTVDKSTLSELSEELRQLSAEKEKKIYGIAGEEFNIGSPKQLGEILFEKLRLIEKPKKTKSGQYATGEEILSKLASEHEIASDILDFRELQKLKSTYVDALPELIGNDQRIHTSLNQAVAATGRLSSANPNLQNIPIRTAQGREIRKAFIPRGEGFVLLSADYSQIELRIMASFAEDESMIEAFRDGRDIHATTASKIFKVPLEEVDADMRRKAKTANFGIIYGITAFGLSQRLNIPRKEAADIIDAYFTEFPAVKQYIDRIINEAREKEYVTTVLGRRRYLRDINSRNPTVRGFAERNAVNAPIQGSAADMIKLAMIKIHDWMMVEKLQSKMILQVHDELVFDAHLEEVDLLSENVTTFMKEAMPLSVPMEIGIGTGQNWLEAH